MNVRAPTSCTRTSTRTQHKHTLVSESLDAIKVHRSVRTRPAQVRIARTRTRTRRHISVQRFTSDDHMRLCVSGLPKRESLTNTHARIHARRHKSGASVHLSLKVLFQRRFQSCPRIHRFLHCNRTTPPHALVQDPQSTLCNLVWFKIEVWRCDLDTIGKMRESEPACEDHTDCLDNWILETCVATPHRTPLRHDAC